MPMPQMPPAQFEKLKQAIETGPPPEPSDETPGKLMQTLMLFEEKFSTENQRKPTPVEYLSFLVRVLDQAQWERDRAAWNQMKQIYDAVQLQAAQPRILVPNMVVPKP